MAARDMTETHFATGDRVAVFSIERDLLGEKGVVTDTDSERLRVKLDGGGEVEVAPHQCQRLGIMANRRENEGQEAA